MKPEVTAFFDEPTFTVSYVVADSATKKCAIIDPVLGYEPASGRTDRISADKIVDFVHKAGLAVEWILETHVHADHLTAAPYLKEQLGGQTGIGAHVGRVQETFAKLFNAEPEFRCDGSQFDALFKESDVFHVGMISSRAIATPGHTPACVTYLIGDAAFVGDTLFMPDYGTARTDFPGGNARELYHSIRKILALPEATRLFMCHDYKTPGRNEYLWETTVAEQRRSNVHIHDAITEDEFVKMRNERDKALDMPRLILPSVQVNMRAGALPPPEDNGISYLKLPLDVF